MADANQTIVGVIGMPDYVFNAVPLYSGFALVKFLRLDVSAETVRGLADASLVGRDRNEGVEIKDIYADHALTVWHSSMLHHSMIAAEFEPTTQGAPK